MALNKNKQEENEKIFEPIHIKEDEDDELDGLELDLEEDLEIDEDEDEDKEEDVLEIELIYDLQKQINHLQKKLSSESISELLLENNNKLTSYIHEIIRQEIKNIDNFNIRKENPDQLKNVLKSLEDISNKINNNGYLADSITKIIHQTLSDYNHNAIITETIQKEMNLLKEQLLLSQKEIITNFMKNIIDDTVSEHFQDRSSLTYKKIKTTIKDLIDKKLSE